MCMVSVIIPVYNSEQYLRKCLESVVHQTLKDIEIICVNDGSTDASLEILKEFAAKDKRVCIIDKENTGYGDSMNAAIKVSHGRYIGIVESDDFAAEEMFERLFRATENGRMDVVRANYYRYGQDIPEMVDEVLEGMPYQIPFSPYSQREIFSRRIYIWSAIYRRDFLLANNIWFTTTPGASYQDIAFNFKVWACAKRVVLIKDAVLHYRTDNAGSSVHSRGKIFAVCDEYDAIWRFLDERPALMKAFRYDVPPLQYGTYEWNYHRIAPEYRTTFLARAVSDFTRMEQMGHLRREAWENEQAWLMLQKMLDQGERFPLWLYLEKQRKREEILGFWAELKSAGRLYVYGAGKVGTEVMQLLRRKRVDVTAVLVSDKTGNPNRLLDAPVLQFSAAGTVQEGDVILVALKEKNQMLIVDMLFNLGYRHILTMSGELRQRLQAS